MRGIKGRGGGSFCWVDWLIIACGAIALIGPPLIVIVLALTHAK